ncbi:MAG: sigma-70 family RNA polymerase sigma factor [Chloroflexi bacterium]|nr:sigma-70 family RNA polymerase sigma factor [Chloroflexota bacterium]
MSQRRAPSNGAETRTRRAYRSNKSLSHRSSPASNHSDSATAPAVSDLVYLYLREISQTPLLTHLEEIELAKAIRRGCQAERKFRNNGHNARLKLRYENEIHQGELARRQLLKANLRLVVNLAKHYLGRGLTFLDLIQEGNLGLMRAVDKFDYRRGHKFSTLATWWIRQAITRAIGNFGNSPRLPAHTGQWLRCLDRTTRSLTQELGRDPTESEIAEQMHMPVPKVRRLMAASAGALSLEMQIGEEQDATLGDFIEDVQTPSPWAAAVESAMRDDMWAALETLTPREVRVLTLRFGLRDGFDQTLEQVGEKFGLTRERVRQIEQSALQKLRAASRAERLESYLGTNFKSPQSSNRKMPM